VDKECTKEYKPFNKPGFRLQVFRGVNCKHMQDMRFYSGEDGGSKILQNGGILPQHHMASQSRRR